MTDNQLTIVMTTYNPPGTLKRMEYARRCIYGLLDNFDGNRGGHMNLHISDDGSDEEELHKLELFAKAWPGMKDVTVTQTRTERKGIGGSLNAAIAQVKTPYFMYTTDDWLLTKPLDLQLAIDLIEKENMDYVRLGPLHPNVECVTRFRQDIGWWLYLYEEEQYGYAFATRPFVAKTKWFIDHPFKENLSAYETERIYVETHQSSMTMAAYPDIAGSMWTHIGEYEVGKIDPTKG